MSRVIEVQADKKFRITIPDDAVLSFGPFSPPPTGKYAAEPRVSHWDQESKAGTLRVYSHGKKDILACFAHVRSFRDLSIGMEVEEMQLKGETVWHSDEKGYHKKSETSATKGWVTPQLEAPEEHDELDPFA